jgi:S-layer homology domain
MKKKIGILVLLAVMMFVSIMPAAMATHTQTFRDVSEDHWAAEAINEMARRGIISGYGDGTFRPNDPVTRAEFAKIMIAAAGVKLTNPNNLKQSFEDVGRNHWAFTYVEHAKPYLTGYKSGNTYTYKPNDNAVREDIAVALVRLLKYDSTKKADLNVLNSFKDRDDISTNLRSFIAIAVSTKLIQGYDDRTFRPQAQLTRAEAASLIYRTKFDDETKVVFPPDTTTPTPTPDPKTYTITDNFSDRKLSKWDIKNADGKWLAHEGSITAYSDDDDLDHLLLPVKWDKFHNAKYYEFEVSIQPDGTDGLGGLFFNGNDGEADLIYVTKDSVEIRRMTDATTSATKLIHSEDYELQSDNKLKIIVVDGKALYVFINDDNIYSNENYSPKGLDLGLYINEDASGNISKKATWLDDFSFKYVK